MAHIRSQQPIKEKTVTVTFSTIKYGGIKDWRASRPDYTVQNYRGDYSVHVRGFLSISQVRPVKYTAPQRSAWWINSCHKCFKIFSYIVIEQRSFRWLKRKRGTWLHIKHGWPSVSPRNKNIQSAHVFIKAFLFVMQRNRWVRVLVSTITVLDWYRFRKDWCGARVSPSVTVSSKIRTLVLSSSNLQSGYWHLISATYHSCFEHARFENNNRSANFK